MNMPLALTAFEWLEDAIGGEVWTYPAIVAAVAFDSLLPVAPGETVMITAGVLAADGDLSPFLVVGAGMAGSLIGDNLSYGLGASLGLATLPRSAPWRSGYAAACKAVYTGSIPVGAFVMKIGDDMVSGVAIRRRTGGRLFPRRTESAALRSEDRTCI